MLMNDTVRGDLYPLFELPKHLPRHADGRRLHKSIGPRWARYGVGGVFLLVVRVGRLLYTSDELVAEFFKAVAAAAGDPSGEGPLVSTRADQVESSLNRELGQI